MRAPLFVVIALLAAAVRSEGGQAADVPAPVAPATINRDAAGHATLRATRLAQPLHVDGKLEEAVYTEVQPASGFIQQEPKEGVPASEKTEVWVFYDDSNVYVVGRCWESRP